MRDFGSKYESERPPRGKKALAGKKGKAQAQARKFFRKKVCKFCSEKVERVDYKDVLRLVKFVTEKGKIVPRRISGNCAWHQRELARAIKRARMVALTPFTGE
ncbi:MAG: 30S ribosomal protein S18 [Candidatus Omnitrophica bacterium]|nr:30S ribosomal protein S18 [Candidatus Omnitrophota bacterium]